MKLSKKIIYIILIILVLSCQKKKTIYIHNYQLNIEIADTKEKQMKGLMFRKNLAANAGMLFVYKKSQKVSFWMKNTFIPLSIAYINANFKIIHMADMSPLDEENHHSSIYPVMYTLEVNQGWFKERNIKIGDYIEGIK